MELLEEYKQGNKVYSLTFPNGETIVFRLLRWKEFSAYAEAVQKGTIPAPVLEQAIFAECVINKKSIDEMHKMLAGVVGTVCSVIMQMSGPTGDAEQFNQELDSLRTQIDTLDSQILMTICRVFPYKPEEVMEMSWDQALMRLVQAERILMREGQIEPIKMLTPEEVAKGQSGTNKGKFNIEEEMRETNKALQSPDFGVGRPDSFEPKELSSKQQEQLRLIQEVRRRRSS